MKTLAQILHAFVSFICMEDTGAGERKPHAKPQTEPAKTLQEIATLADAVMAYRRAAGDVAMEKLLFKEVVARAHGPDDWVYVAEMTPTSSDLKQLAVDEFAATATSFSQYEKVHQLSGRPVQQSGALEKMVALASSVDEKLRVYELVDVDSPRGVKIFQELTAQARSLEEWEKLFEGADSESSLERFAAMRIIEMTDTLEGLADLLCNGQIADVLGLESMIFEKIRRLNVPFDDWQSVAEGYDGSVETLAVEKMIEVATTIDEMLATAEEVDGDNGTEEKLVHKAESAFDWTEEHCRKVLDEYDDDNVLFGVALKKLLAMMKTAPQCLGIYLEWDFSDENNTLVLDSLFEVSTAGERAIIALVAEEGSQLQGWAHENA